MNKLVTTTLVLTFSSLSFAGNLICQKAKLAKLTTSKSITSLADFGTPETDFCKMKESEIPKGMLETISRLGEIHQKLETKINAAGLKFVLHPVNLHILGHDSGAFISVYEPSMYEDNFYPETDYEGPRVLVEPGKIILGVFPNWGEHNFDLPENTYIHELGHQIFDYGEDTFGMRHLGVVLESFTLSEAFADWTQFFTMDFNSELPASQYPSCATIRPLNKEYTYYEPISQFLDTAETQVLLNCCISERESGSESEFTKYICPKLENNHIERPEKLFTPELAVSSLPDPNKEKGSSLSMHRYGLPLSSLMQQFESQSSLTTLELLAKTLNGSSEKDLINKIHCRLEEFPEFKVADYKVLSFKKLWKELSKNIPTEDQKLWAKLEQQYGVDLGVRGDELISLKAALYLAWETFDYDASTEQRNKCNLEGCEMICEKR